MEVASFEDFFGRTIEFMRHIGRKDRFLFLGSNCCIYPYRTVVRLAGSVCTVTDIAQFLAI